MADDEIKPVAWMTDGDRRRLDANGTADCRLYGTRFSDLFPIPLYPASAIEALRAERYEALREIDRVAGISSHAKNSLAVAEAQVSTLSRQLEEAREALAPFTLPGMTWRHGDRVTITVAISDIEAARRSALEASNEAPSH
jgi:hypothetical protein